ncbi:MAG: translation initiation factor IF-2 [bacterium]|nr:translation initiation factor IF-2 [bacterium]
MQSIKLHEATKQFKISNKLAMFFLGKKNIPVKSHSSVISMEQLEQLREFARNKDKSEIYNDFNRAEKDKKRKAKEAKIRKENGDDITTTPVPPKADVAKPTQPKPEPARPHITEEQKAKVEAKRENDARREELKREEIRKENIRREEVRRENARKEELRKEEAKKEEARKEEARKEDAKKEEARREAAKKEREIQRIRPVVKPKYSEPERISESAKKAPEKQRVERKPAPQENIKKEQKPQKGNVAKAPAPNQNAPRPPKTAEVPQRDKKTAKADPRQAQPQDKRKTPPPPQGQRHQRPQGQGKSKHFQSHYQKQKTAPTPRPKPKPKVYENLPELIQISDYINVKELADKLTLKVRDIEEKMGALNKVYVTNQILDVEDIKEISGEFGVEVDIVSYEDALFYNQIEKSKSQLSTRAPMVTVMGHVDHGKTTLLDTLRNTRVADREAGGITQKIGAYKLTYNGMDIVFLDTPGHEAFTNIRARGASITDIVILVVAANDGVKPQTIEAINHAQAAGVPIVVAINKIDLPGADPSKVKQELTKHNILVEDWGGDVVAVDISAKNNQNLEALLEMVGLVSEMLELKAYKDIPARGAIIESRLDPKLGPLGTVLLQHGKIKRGDFFICGDSVGKIKSIFNDHGEVLQEAQVPLPVEIMGFETVPEAGERFQITNDIEKAKKVIEMRKVREKAAKHVEVTDNKKLSLQNLFEKLGENKIKEFPIIIKNDNFSSGEVLETILLKQSHEKLKINIVHQGIGNITESDVLLASTSNAILLGFNVKAPQKILGLAKREQVEIKLYNVIYHLIEDIEKAIKGEIEPEYIDTFIGQVEVLQTFKISKVGIIAGCLVKEGKVTNKCKIKVLRNNDLVFEGKIETLKRVKNDVSEVNAGTECGIKVKNFNAIEVGDSLEVFESRIKE